MQSRVSLTGTDSHGVVDLGSLARTLRDTLGLRLPPVALAFVMQPPEGIDSFADEVPSACALWRYGEERTFFAPAKTHYNCPIGALTMGFSMSEPQQNLLMELVGQMGAIGYVQADEAGNIPSVPVDKSGIAYGPLETFPVEPDAVLVWVSATSAMLLAEATGTSRWTPEQHGTATFGRPSCAAIPAAIRHQAATFSLGCTGMRTFTGIDADLQLAVLPKPALTGLGQRLAAVAAANAQMAAYYTGQMKRFAPRAASAS